MMQKLKFFHRAPNAIRSDGGRNLIGRRTESDWAANGIRSGGGRNPIGRRTESDRTADANGGKNAEGYGAESKKIRTIRRRLRH